LNLINNPHQGSRDFSGNLLLQKMTAIIERIIFFIVFTYCFEINFSFWFPELSQGQATALSDTFRIFSSSRIS